MIAQEVIGMDLSLRRPAFVGLTSADFASARVGVIEPKADGIVRLVEIVRAVQEFFSASPAENVAAYVEQHAFSAVGGAWSLERAELVGAVKVMLAKRGLVVTPVVASSARKLLFGKLPRMRREELKKFVVHQLGLMGADSRFANDDECDAFAIANWGLNDRGLVAMSAGDGT